MLVGAFTIHLFYFSRIRPILISLHTVEHTTRNEFMQNEARTSWWDDLTFTGQYQLVKDGKFGFWAGWYDIFLVGNLAAYQVQYGHARGSFFIH